MEDDPELNMLVGPPDRPVGGASCGRPPDARYRRDERVLNIYNWNDYYIDDRTIPLLQAQTNLRVNYDVYSSNEDLLARMRAGPTEYDITVPTSWFVPTYLKLGLIEPLRTDLMPNLTGRVTLLREVTDLIGCALIYLGHSPNSIKDSDLATWSSWSAPSGPSRRGSPPKENYVLIPTCRPASPATSATAPRCRWPIRCSPPAQTKLSIITLTGQKLEKWQAAYDAIVK